MKFLKKHKKGLIVLLIVILVIVGAVFGLKRLGDKTIEQLNQMTTETAIAESRDLVSVVSATGKVVSKESKNISSVATGAKILEVSVEIGDEVKAGDTLVLLDSGNIEKNLENLKQNLETTKQLNALQINSAQRTLNDTLANTQITQDRFNDQVNDSNESIKEAKDLRDQAENLYNNAVEARENASKNYDDAVKSLAEINKKIDKAKKSVNSADTTALDALKAELTKTQTLISTYKGALDMAKQAESAQLANYQSYKTTVENLEKSLENLNQTISDSQRSSDAQVSASKDSLTSVKLQTSGNTFSLETQIESLEEQKEACVVTAPISGIVTNIMVEEGTTYSGVPLVTIEDISAYDITTEIDEYDIGKIKVGQKVVIKTNGTDDTELKGTVKSIAPRASLGTSVTYTVKISLDSKDDRIRLDMTAKLSIVLSESNNTLTVPYDAVMKDDDGNTFVKIVEGKNEDGSLKTKEVSVTTGIETDYYTEILSGDIKSGDEVLVERAHSNVFDFSAMFDRNAMGGM